MRYIRYSIVFLFLLIFNLALSSWWLIAAWFCLGLAVPILLRGVRFPLLLVVLSELAIGLLFWAVVWSRSGILTNLALNFDFPTAALASIAVGMNMLMALFCVGTSLYIRKWISAGF
ncbi:MAG TPA: hypothetical protein VFE32_19540 [Puia sp.]|nr:hypothetical protein [Puia sp.]